MQNLYAIDSVPNTTFAEKFEDIQAELKIVFQYILFQVTIHQTISNVGAQKIEFPVHTICVPLSAEIVNVEAVILLSIKFLLDEVRVPVVLNSLFNIGI